MLFIQVYKKLNTVILTLNSKPILNNSSSQYHISTPSVFFYSALWMPRSIKLKGLYFRSIKMHKGSIRLKTKTLWIFDIR